jgi:hypothetical protein
VIGAMPEPSDDISRGIERALRFEKGLAQPFARDGRDIASTAAREPGEFHGLREHRAVLRALGTVLAKGNDGGLHKSLGRSVNFAGHCLDLFADCFDLMVPGTEPLERGLQQNRGIARQQRHQGSADPGGVFKGRVK